MVFVLESYLLAKNWGTVVIPPFKYFGKRKTAVTTMAIAAKVSQAITKIPSLKDLLNLVQGKVPLLIEIKSESPIVSLTHQVLTLLNDYQGKVAIHSFDPKVVRLLKKEAPHLLRGQIACYFKNESMFFLKKWALKHMVYNLINGPDFVTYAIEDAPNKMLNRHKKKMPIIGYTAKNKKAYTEALNYFDNAVFEGFEA